MPGGMIFLYGSVYVLYHGAGYAHILHARDLKGPEYVASIQAQLLQVERYLLDQKGKALGGMEPLSPSFPPRL